MHDADCEKLLYDSQDQAPHLYISDNSVLCTLFSQSDENNFQNFYLLHVYDLFVQNSNVFNISDQNIVEIHW